jgi:hypothetical protein
MAILRVTPVSPRAAESTQDTIELVVLGSSGHAREVLWIAASAGNYRVVGCVGPQPNDIRRLPVPWLGADEWLADADRNIRFVIGTGSGRTRARLDQVAHRDGRRCSTLAHPAAVIGARVSLGEGNVIWPGAVLTADITLGRHVHVNAGVTVGHDAHADDYVTFLPGCTASGSTRIGSGSTIGAGATVIDGVTIGANVMVGAGAVVIGDVPDNTVVVGVPARVLRKSPAPYESQVHPARGEAWGE